MKPIPGFPDYSISEDGTVYSFRTGDKSKGKIRKTRINSRNRVQVILRDPNGDSKSWKVSRLVAITFIPNPENLPIVMHRDNNTLNNHKDNLKWGTYAENSQQCVKDGRHWPSFKD